MRRPVIASIVVIVVVAVLVYLHQPKRDTLPRLIRNRAVPSDKTARVPDRAHLPVAPQASGEVRPTPEAAGEPALPTASISGTVRIHGTSTPAVGVRVRGLSNQIGSILTHTDRNGSYTLANIVPPLWGSYFSINAEGEEANLFMLESPGVTVKPGEAKTGVNLTLYAGRNGSISGKVMGRRIVYQKPDGSTSKPTVFDFERAEDTPWPGAKIVLVGLRGRGRQETVSDAAGRYRFNDLRADDYSVWAELPSGAVKDRITLCLLYTSPSPRDRTRSRMPSSA